MSLFQLSSDDCAPFYAIVKFSGERDSDEQQTQGIYAPEETGTGVVYQNLTADRNPVSGHSRGVVNHEGDYANTGPLRSSWYDKLQLFRPMALDWLRNAWGNVDEDGHPAYDVMQRVKQNFVPYDKLENTVRDDLARRRLESSDPTYDAPERPPVAIV